jgi:hypothetical protein
MAFPDATVQVNGQRWVLVLVKWAFAFGVLALPDDLDASALKLLPNAMVPFELFAGH